tara:strand:- start:2101 stop:2298 length:198 start_codon:yes stop_codon:yes gene_type:complete
MNEIKETQVKRECFRVAGELMATILKIRKATQVDKVSTSDEIYQLALTLYKDGKSRYWASNKEEK